MRQRVLQRSLGHPGQLTFERLRAAALEHLDEVILGNRGQLWARAATELQETWAVASTCSIAHRSR